MNTKRCVCILLGIMMLLGVIGSSSAETKILLGDANGDGVVNSADASAILRASVGLASAGNMQELADVDLNNSLNAADAAAILRYCVGAQDFVLSGTLMFRGGALQDSYLYDGSLFDLNTVTYTNPACSVSVKPIGNDLPMSFTNAGQYGTYEITLEHPKYVIGGKVEYTAEIRKATYDMSGVTFKSEIQYRDSESMEDTVEYHTITIKGELPEGVTVAYYCEGEPFTSASFVGKYEITAVFTGDYVNYEQIPDMKATLDIRSPWTGWLKLD